MSDEECSDIDSMLLEPYPEDNLPGLRKRYTVVMDSQDKNSKEPVNEIVKFYQSESETEITQQDFVTKNQIFTISNEIILSSGSLHIPICDKKIHALLITEKLSFKYSEFLDINRCLIGCHSAPHTHDQLLSIGKVIREIEFHLSKINLMCDLYLRSNIDHKGWVRCYFIYHYLQFSQMNVTYDAFKMGLRHSQKISFDVSGNNIRTNDFTELGEHDNNEAHHKILKVVSLIPKSGLIDSDKIRNILTIRGCHQKMVMAFNNQMRLQLSGKVPDVSKYYIHHIPEEYEYDKYLKYL